MRTNEPNIDVVYRVVHISRQRFISRHRFADPLNNSRHARANFRCNAIALGDYAR